MLNKLLATAALAAGILTQTPAQPEIQLTPEGEFEIIQAVIKIFKGDNNSGSAEYDRHKRVLTIKASPGGNPNRYVTMVTLLGFTGVKLRVDGPCYSACATAFELSRNRCLTKNARLGYHMTRIYTPSGELKELRKPELPSLLMEWIEEHGGFPEDEGLTIMMYPDTAKFYEICDD